MEGVRGMVCWFEGPLPATMSWVWPADVWITRGVLSTVMGWPGAMVVEPPDVPITKPPPDGS